MNKMWWIALGLMATGGCGDDDAPRDGGADTAVADSGIDTAVMDTGSDTGGDTAAPDCLADPDLTRVGEATPFTGFEFRNAFDPSDTTIYDPDDVSSLPGPLMVDAWGSRGTAAFGTMAVFPPGFAAPLHTHSAEYWGVVLRGEMTNPFGSDLAVFVDADDTNNNGSVVLAPGSHWHVPAGAQHTTTCVGPEVCWFYFHGEEAFDFTPLVDGTGALMDGVTLDTTAPAGSVELPNADLVFAGDPGSFVQFAPAWGDFGTGAHGTFGLFEAGAVSPVHVHSETYYGVVVSGSLTNPFNLEPDPTVLGMGGYWTPPADSVHVTACEAGAPCLFYFHSRGAFDFTPLCDQP